jgi:excisionase family DNA binding protein
MKPRLSHHAWGTRLCSEEEPMATTLAATALQLSEAASRKGSPEYDSLKALFALLSQANYHEVRLAVGDSESVAVPGLMADLLRQVGAVLDRGDGLVVSEVARELTTSEAARVLGVSRPTLISLLDKGSIRSHRVGTHRRVALQDVLAYRRQRISEQRDAYEALITEQDDLGIFE